MGGILSVVGGVVETLLSLYLVVLIVRLVLEYIPLFNRSWRPRGAGLVAAEIVYTITDPPIRFFRKRIPPLRLGATLAIDLGFTVTMLSVLILMTIVRAIT